LQKDFAKMCVQVHSRWRRRERDDDDDVKEELHCDDGWIRALKNSSRKNPPRKSLDKSCALPMGGGMSLCSGILRGTRSRGDALQVPGAAPDPGRGGLLALAPGHICDDVVK
jgi:hypothetical protein